MTNTRVLRHESTWALFNLITTNASQRELVSVARSAAAPVLYRMLEIDVDDMPDFGNDLRASYEADQADITHQCIGALGAMIHLEMCRMGTLALSKLVLECSARAAKLLDANQTDRFQYRGLGAMIALQAVLRKLGMEMFDLRALIAEFRTAYGVNKDFVVENTLPTNPLSILSRALIELAPHTVVAFEEPSGRGNSRTVRALNARMPDVIKGRHIQSTGITYMSVKALKEWCREAGISDRSIMVEARAAGVLETREWMDKGKLQPRNHGPKVLTKGLEGDMGLRLDAYTFNVGKLNGILRIDDSGFVLHENPPPEPGTATGTAE